MRILHTADWHLGKSLGRIPRHEEQVAVLDEICGIADREQVHGVVIAGDLFDTFNPPVESIELFYRALKRLACDGTRLVVAVAGNHDSPERIESPDPLARECGIVFVGSPLTRVHPFALPSGLAVIASDEGFIEVAVPGVDTALRLVVTPYANERRMKTYLGSTDPEEQLRSILQAKWNSICRQYCDDRGINVMVSHLFVTSKGEDIEPEPEGEKPILDVGGAQAIFTDELPAYVQYVALGHLHRPIIMHRNDTVIAYSGSPLSYSFSEAEQAKSVFIIDLKKGMPASVRPIPLESGKRVFRKTFSSVTEAVGWLKQNQGTLVELTIQSDTYLSAEQQKMIHAAHDGIVDIVPTVASADGGKASLIDASSLSKSVEELFKDYFRHKTDQDPNAQIITILREVMSAEVE